LVISGNTQRVDLDKVLDDLDRRINLTGLDQTTREFLPDLRIRRPQVDDLPVKRQSFVGLTR
jgi:hypothetical protein